jgi:hypothetical protein
MLWNENQDIAKKIRRGDCTPDFSKKGSSDYKTLRSRKMGRGLEDEVICFTSLPGDFY